MSAPRNSPDWAAGLTFKVASAEERVQALALRSRIYQSELGTPGIDHFDDEAWHLVALDPDGQVVATLRLAGPQQRPFDLESLIELETVLPAGRTIGDLSRFCVHPDYRRVRSGQFVHMGMLKLLYQVSRRNCVTDLVTLALPHLEVMYRAVFFRAVEAGRLTHPLFGPVTLMRFDLIDAEERYRGSSRPFAKFLFQGDLPNVRG